MMLGDDIRNHRIQAEKDAAFGKGNHTDDPLYLQARGILALFVMAEELYELRRNIEITLEKLEDGGKL